MWLSGLSAGLQTKGLPLPIPSQDTCLGCRPGPQLGTCEREPIDISLTHWWFSPSLSPSLSRSLKINFFKKQVENSDD